MSDHAEKVRAALLPHTWNLTRGEHDSDCPVCAASVTLDALVSERDGLRARVEQLEAALRDATRVIEDYSDGRIGPNVALGKIGRRILALSGLGDAGK